MSDLQPQSIIVILDTHQPSGCEESLRESAITQQYELQLQIVARMNSLGMRPILTCFAGHVPNAVHRLYPNASTLQSPDWGGFPEPYCCVQLLDFAEPLFAQIGKTFIEMQTKYYGTSHIYQCDTVELQCSLRLEN